MSTPPSLAFVVGVATNGKRLISHPMREILILVPKKPVDLFMIWSIKLLIQILYICTSLACYDVSIKEYYKDDCKAFFKHEVVSVTCVGETTYGFLLNKDSILESVLIWDLGSYVGRIEMEPQ